MSFLFDCKFLIKQFNFRIEYGTKTPALQLIDFGTTIDMDFYSPDDVFTSKVQTEHFECCEMRENKPWTFQSDLFGIAGTSHVMLFGKYMEVEKKVLTWVPKTRMPRYFNKILWDNFFSTLLNIDSCDSRPNLQALKDEFEVEIQQKKKFVCDKIADFNKTLDSN